VDETPALRSLKAALEDIRTKADQALKHLQQPEETRAPKWRCTGCGHTKHFTRPVPMETAAPCPKCGGKTFEVVAM